MTSPPSPPFPDSLCHRCQFLRLNGNHRGSVFMACSEPTMPRYLPQPIRACRRFVAAAPPSP